MRKIFLSIAFIMCTAIGFAQVGIGTITPNASSVLDLTSTNKAFLPPRLTSAQRNAIVSPMAGMVIFNTNDSCIEIYRGTTGWFNVCTGTSSAPLPPVDGYTSSNQVASANLIGYWPFDGSTIESIHNEAPVLTGGTSSYVTGKIGQAIKFTEGWLTYPNTASGAGIATDAFNSSDTLQNGFTVSLWAQVPDTSLLTNLFQLSTPNIPNWPILGVAYRKYASGLVDFDGGLANVDGTGPHVTYAAGFEPTAFKDSLSWAFITMAYDTSGHQLIYYANGAKVGSYALGTAIFPNPESLLMITPNYATIGTFEGYGNTPGDTNTGNVVGTTPANNFMSNGITGVIDDIRFFNTTLTAQQVNDLFQLGNQGR